MFRVEIRYDLNGSAESVVEYFDTQDDAFNYASEWNDKTKVLWSKIETLTEPTNSGAV